jgi:tetratricopeptide (TPR) repeat protein
MSRDIRRKDLKQDEFVEAAFDFGHWLEHNWRIVVRWLAVVLVGVVIGLAVWGWQGYRRGQVAAALESALGDFSKAEASQFGDVDALVAALEGFERAEAKGGSSTSGLLARYYRGVVLYRLGRVDEAIPVVESCVERLDDDLTLAWAAQALLADLYVQSGQRQRAVELLEGLVGEEEGGFPAGQALLALGRIHEEAGDAEAARVAWQRIVDDYPLSPASATARGLLQN